MTSTGDDEPSSPAEPATDWWRNAVIYQVYLRSFADGDGDGVGDLRGLLSRLRYLAGLGVDAVWITPWYPSPMADGGYDVADFRGVDPLFGTLDDATRVIDTAHDLGLRVILDIVPNHTSTDHAWFRAALASGRGSAARYRYLFRDGRGPGGDKPPNDWPSAFGGSAWTRVTEPDGQPGQWYLHLFAAEQADLDWTSADVRADFERTLRFWFDRGVDGFRVDVAMGLAKDPGLPDLGPLEPGLPGRPAWVSDHPYYDRDEVHGVWRAWRNVADGYQPPRVFVGEVALTSPERLARYLRPDELHAAFNFDFQKCPWDAGRLRSVIDRTLGTLSTVGAPATWVLSSHDETRHLTRLGLPETGWRHPALPDTGHPDLALGTRRARAAVLLMLGLPGVANLYQGEELGLWQVPDIPEVLLRDPTWERSGHTIRGRDGCRVPMPWEGDAPPFGFGPPGITPWLPQPASWQGLTVAAEDRDGASMLALYRDALRIRRADPDLRGDRFAWLESAPGTLMFERGNGFRCGLNLSGEPMSLPPGRSTLVRSATATGDHLRSDTAEWFRA